MVVFCPGPAQHHEKRREAGEQHGLEAGHAPRARGGKEQPGRKQQIRPALRRENAQPLQGEGVGVEVGQSRHAPGKVERLREKAAASGRIDGYERGRADDERDPGKGRRGLHAPAQHTVEEKPEQRRPGLLFGQQRANGEKRREDQGPGGPGRVQGAAKRPGRQEEEGPGRHVRPGEMAVFVERRGEKGAGSHGCRRFRVRFPAHQGENRDE